MALKTVVAVVGSVVATILVAWPAAVWWEVSRLEKPKYRVLRTLTRKGAWTGKDTLAAEIRRYDPYLVAEVTLEGEEMRPALTKGFRMVANFIFGNNVSAAGTSESVAMTSPVAVESGTSGQDAESLHGGDGVKVAMTSPVASELVGSSHTVSFMMPSKYTKDMLPRPKNANVRIKEVPARTLAAIGWRGSSPPQATVDAKMHELVKVLEANSIEVVDRGTVLLYQYYPPFCPGWLRLNEVLLQVEQLEA